MKVFGIVLIIIGILMLVFRSFSFTHEKKVVDLGPLQVNKKEEKTVGWPVYAGGIAVVAGIAMIALDKRNA